MPDPQYALCNCLLLLIRIHFVGHVGIPWYCQRSAAKDWAACGPTRHRAQASVICALKGRESPNLQHHGLHWGPRCWPPDSWSSWEECGGFKEDPWSTGGSACTLRAEGSLTRGKKARKDLVVSRMLEVGGTCGKGTQRSFRCSGQSRRSEERWGSGGIFSNVASWLLRVTMAMARCPFCIHHGHTSPWDPDCSPWAISDMQDSIRGSTRVRFAIMQI